MRYFHLAAIAAGMAVSFLLPAKNASPDMRIWYDRIPDANWTAPLPIGNGYLAGLVYGKVWDEKIALNETSFWSGVPHCYDDPEAGKWFEPVKRLVFDRKFRQAEQIIDRHFYGTPVAQQCYEPLGDLRMRFLDMETPEAGRYVRDLDMETGITSVQFTVRGVTYRREAFVSYPDNVLVVRISADRPGSISLETWLESLFEDCVSISGNTLTLDGQWEGPLPQYWLIAPSEEKGIRFRTVVKAIPEGGTLDQVKRRVRIRHADAVTLVLSAATSYVNFERIDADPAERVGRTLAGVEGKDYTTLRREQEEAFSGKMGRVHLEIGDASRNEIPTDRRIGELVSGTPDPALEALCFQFGRYMTVAGSRSGGQPATLQSIWNERITPPWGSKYTININIQMNYWPAEVTNLSECHLPLFEMLRETAVSGARTAKTYYGIDKGWVAHHNLDLWRGTAPVDGARFGMWPVGGAWLCQHIWEHYAFTRDKEFLREYYPVLKGAAEFLVNLLVEHPDLGYLVTPFSMSPEHGFLDDDGQPAYISPAPMMDVAIMRDLFPHVIEASRILSVDKALRKQLESALKRLPPYKVNHNGFPQEWVEDFNYRAGGHDVSPYFPLFPGNSVQTHRAEDREMVESYRRWMESRGTGSGGFPSSWNISMWARLGRGDKAGEQIHALTERMAQQFLLQGTGAQVDAPFGYTAGIAESLLQSHENEISLLPALPEGWPSGRVTGLRARGGYTVDIVWRDGCLEEAVLRGSPQEKVRIRVGNRVSTLLIPASGQLTVRL